MKKNTSQTFWVGLGLLGLAGVLVLPVGGCLQKPPAKARIVGKVTMDGKPVTGGTVYLTLSNKSRMEVPFDANGSFVASNVPVGETKFRVSTERAKIKGDSQAPGQDKLTPEEKQEYDKLSGTAGGDKQKPLQYMAIAKKYKSFKTSGLVETLTAGRNDIELKLAKE